jgi:6-pyruvoyltetrahydropterin/6-carboxytetrahydropterin synthase
MFVTREFKFDAAHFLTDYYGKCERMHGHTYKLQVTLEGEIQSNGLVIDFVILKRIVKKYVLDKLDHHLLNDLIDNPTAERIVTWIWKQLEDLGKLLKEELKDPNLSKEIKAFFKKSDQKDLKFEAKFAKTLRLYELKLCETESACVTLRMKN